VDVAYASWFLALANDEAKSVNSVVLLFNRYKLPVRVFKPVRESRLLMTDVLTRQTALTVGASVQPRGKEREVVAYIPDEANACEL
jgi:hypothetical protein